jgi:hypothetical protein
MKKYSYIYPNVDKLTNLGFYKPHKKGNWLYQPPCDFCYIEINWKTKEVVCEIECCDFQIKNTLETLIELKMIKEVEDG